MICSGCQKELEGDPAFCPNCGLAVARGSTVHPPSGTITTGDVGMIKDSTFHSEVHQDSHNVQDSHDTHDSHNVSHDSHNVNGAPAVGGSQTIIFGNEKEARATKTGEKCPICGRLAKDDYFHCKSCGRDFICLLHQNRQNFLCHECSPEVTIPPIRRFDLRGEKAAPSDGIRYQESRGQESVEPKSVTGSDRNKRKTRILEMLTVSIAFSIVVLIGYKWYFPPKESMKASTSATDATSLRSASVDPPTTSRPTTIPAPQQLDIPRAQTAPKAQPVKGGSVKDQDSRISDLRSVINPDASISPNRINIALAIDSDRKDGGIDIVRNSLNDIISNERINAVNNYFNEGFFRKGFFADIYGGNTDILKQTNSLTKIDFLFIGRVTFSYKKQSQLDSDLVSCNLTLNYKVLDNKFNRIKSDSLIVIGPGFSEQAATERAVEIMKEKYSTQIAKSVP